MTKTFVEGFEQVTTRVPLESSPSSVPCPCGWMMAGTRFSSTCQISPGGHMARTTSRPWECRYCTFHTGSPILGALGHSGWLTGWLMAHGAEQCEASSQSPQGIIQEVLASKKVQKVIWGLLKRKVNSTSNLPPPAKVFLDLCMWMFCLQVHLCTMFVSGALEGQKKLLDTKKLSTGVRDGCELLCGSWELNLDPLQKQQVLWPLKQLSSPLNYTHMRMRARAHTQCTTCMPGTWGSQKRVSDTLELKLKIAVSHCMDPGNWIPVLSLQEQVINQWAISPSPESSYCWNPRQSNASLLIEMKFLGYHEKASERIRKRGNNCI